MANLCLHLHSFSIQHILIARHTTNHGRVSTEGTESGHLSGVICRSLGCEYEPQHCHCYNTAYGVAALRLATLFMAAAGSVRELRSLRSL